MKKLVLALTALAVVLFGAVDPGTASAYPPGSPITLTVTPASGGPGFAFVATVNGCFPGETVEFRLNGGSLVTTTCSATTFQASANFIAPAIVAFYPVTATMLGLPATIPTRPLVLSAQIQVIALPDTGGEDGSSAPGGGGVLPDTGGGVLPDTGGGGVPGLGNPQVPAGGLPSTGSNGIGTNLAVGGVVLLVGIGLLVVAGIRRRNTTTPSPA